MFVTLRRTATVGVLALAAGLALVACGSSGSANGGGGSSGTTGTTVPANGAPLLVGAINTESNGTTGASHDLRNSLNLWASYTNAHGGVNGHPVKLFQLDDKNDPATALSDAQTLVNQDHVIAILDGSSQDAAFVSFVTSAKVPVISTDQAGDGFQFQVQPDFFANGTTVLTILWGQEKAAAEAGAKTYGLIYCTEEPACAQAAPVTKSLAKSVPIDVVYVAGASNSQPNYTAVCLGAQNAGAKALFPAGVAPSRIADDCARQNYHPIWITSQGTVSPQDIKDPNLSTATGDLQDFPWMLDSTPAQKLFHTVEDSELAKAQTQANVAFAYVGAQLFAKAASVGVSKSSTSPSAQDILTGLYSLHGETLGGLAPPLTFTQGKANPVNCTFLYGVKNGKYAATHGDQTFCQPTSS